MNHLLSESSEMQVMRATPPRSALNLLTARKCDAAQPGETLRDGGGLYLEVRQNGTKFWRFRYTRPNASQLPAAKRRNRISLGAYPNPVSLAAARDQRDLYRAQLELGTDPIKQRRAEAAQEALHNDHTLKSIADTWLRKQPWSPSHLAEWERTLKRNVFDQVIERRPLGLWPITEIQIRHLMIVLQRMEDAGLIETLHRCRQKLAHIFNRAIVLELRSDNPVLPLTKEFIPRRRNVTGWIALPWSLVGPFQIDVIDATARPLTKLATLFMLHTVQRNFEMRGAEWSEFDLKRQTWTISASRMKGNPNAREDQLVPLSKQALTLLSEIETLGLSDHCVFPADPGSGAKHPWMSENTMQKLCHQLGYKGKMHIHGLRKTFSTYMNGYRPAFRGSDERDLLLRGIETDLFQDLPQPERHI
ncbi:MAG: DUF4102 domain-containing protein [Gammaproteobacteria bacterium]|nr:MAG: DUF4102 domain-containing protein [Gammaproteobacteria bacterium]